jgi:hypothetical protein
MSEGKQAARRRAGVTAVLLVLAGGLLGVLVDRLWLLPAQAQAAPLTAQAMAAHLALGPADEARIRALLDSMHADVTAAVRQGPDALHEAAHTAHRRLEAALPEDARAGFRAWMRDQHHRMIERMGGEPMHGPGSTRHP